MSSHWEKRNPFTRLIALKSPESKCPAPLWSLAVKATFRAHGKVSVKKMKMDGQ
jgi:hypothetical protein